jgi:regulator of protease activity HflC (stomatin/prohibitin superfamily)
MQEIVSLVGYILIGIIALWLLRSSIVIIPGDRIGLVERKYFGKDLPQDRVIAMRGQVGYQAWTLSPGLHLLIPFIYSVKKVPFVEIQEGAVGIVSAIDGSPLEYGHIFGRSVKGHNKFQDAEAFLANGGQKGPQVEIIPPGMYKINTRLFTVKLVHETEIERDRIGIVTSADGAPIDSGRLLGKAIQGHCNFQDGDVFLVNGGQKGPQIDVLLPGKYRINTDLFKINLGEATSIRAGSIGQVTARDGQPLPEGELVAKAVVGHTNFQNGDEFLRCGGVRGPQLEVLPPGKYYINPFLFSVTLDDAAVVNQGQVAVIVSNIGENPAGSPAIDNPDGANKFETYVVPNGFRGIQKEVVGPGTYYINRIAIKPVIIDTTNITIDWDEEGSTKFDSLKVISKDGFEIKVGVKVVIRVQPEQAPYMVARIGSIENLITNVIHPLIDSSFRNQASTAAAMQFMQDRHEQQQLALERAISELSQYHVEVLSVLICQIVLPADLMETQTNKVLSDQRQSMYEQQKLSEVKRIDMEKTKAQANKQADLVAAEIDVQIAAQKKQEAITKAEGESERLKLEGIGEGEKILSIGRATAEAYNLAKEAVGADGLVAIETMKLISEGKVNITPEVQVGAGGSLVDVLLANMVKKKAIPQTAPIPIKGFAQEEAAPTKEE